MNNLRTLQESLQNYLLDGTTAIQDFVKVPVNGAVNERLAIYRDNYQLTLTAHLYKDFPHIATLLGMAAFEQLAMAYMAAYPSTQFSIKNFSLHLPEFLQITAPYNATLYLSELAQLSLALDQAIIAADTAPLTAQALANVAPESWGDLRFTLQPSVQLLTQQYNTAEIWSALKRAELPPAVVSSAPIYCLVWQQQLVPQFCCLPEAAAGIITALGAQSSFAEICESLASMLPEAEVTPYAVQQLIQGIQHGIFAAITTTTIAE